MESSPKELFRSRNLRLNTFVYVVLILATNHVSDAENSGCNRTYTINHGHVNFTGTDASVNSSVSVTCEEGYKVHGPMYVTCLPEGVWSNDTTCVVKDCGHIPPPIHGAVSYSSNRTTFKEEATFICDLGYYLSHDKTRTCEAIGNWRGNTPECIIKDCGIIPAPLHGAVLYSNDRTTYQEVATFTCDLGFYLSLDKTRTCEASGNWGGTTPHCIIQDCGAIPAPLHGGVTYSNDRTTYKEVATFTCDVGYYLSYDEARTCEATGNWRGNTPECIIKDCGNIPAPVHGEVFYSNNRTTYQEEAAFTCDLGFYLSHDVTRTCEASGNWGGTTPDCIITVSYSNDRTTYKAMATFTCDLGYYMSHDETRECGAFGKWEGTTPRCILKDCGYIPAPLHGTVSYSNNRTTYLEVATFTCDNGYFLSHDETRTCEASGNWRGTAPFYCGNISAPLHGAVSYTNNRTTYPEVATFTCDLGYFLSHNVPRTCEVSGNWGGTTPDCLITDCGDIFAPVHGYVTYSNDRTTYQEETTFTCDLGYYLSHDETRTCEASGNWGGTTPDCVIKDCGDIFAPVHGSVTYSNGRTSYQELASFTCDLGYYLSHDETRTCEASGNWGGTTPDCILTDCGEIQVPVHGSVSYSSNRTTYQEVATFACDYGYFVSHDVKRTCEASGIWNGTTPDCIVRDCDDVPAPLHGAVSYSNNRTTYQEVATITCDLGYYLSHNVPMTCEATGTWGGITPDCIVKDCDDLPAPLHGAVSYSNNRTTYQEVATFTCDIGYYLSDDVPRICEASGNWGGSPPNCIIKDCGDIPAPFHGTVSYSNDRTTYQEVAKFTCDLGYHLSHDETRTCEASGKWAGTTPDCIIKDCGSNHTIPNGYVEFLGRNTTYNNTFKVICSPGYEIHGNPKITCLHHGSWSNDTACHIKDCGNDVSIEHGKVTFEGRATTFNETIPITCNIGYQIQGGDHITCLPEGIWSNTSRCVIKDCGNVFALERGSINFTGKKTTFNESIPVNCDLGYEIRGDNHITCLAEGVWSTNSACHIKDCGSNYSVEFGYAAFSDRNTTYNQTIAVVCRDDYEIQGDPAIICLHDGTWSNGSRCVATDTIGNYLIPILAGVIPMFAVLSIFGVVLVFYLKRKRKGCFVNEDEGPSFEQFDMEFRSWREFRPGPINLVDFPAYVNKMHENSDLLFADGFRRLEEEAPTHPRTVAEMESCRLKSRYTDILPFDHSRVKLIPFDDEEGSDFINASYIPGYILRREYIVTQGPMLSTKDDFWQMVWEQKVDIIVMLTKCVERGRRKCERYWPDQVQEPVFAGELVINMRSESVLSDHFIRIIEVTYGTKTQIVTHFQYLKWPDHGCPRGTWQLLNFITMVRQFRRPNSAGPMLVHCSAGVGRTGTYIAVDRLLQHIRDHDDVDVYSVLLDMRNYRCHMVQTEDQFIYVYECLRHFITKESDSGDAVSASPYPSAAYQESAFDNSAFQRE